MLGVRHVSNNGPRLQFASLPCHLTLAPGRQSQIYVIQDKVIMQHAHHPQSGEKGAATERICETPGERRSILHRLSRPCKYERGKKRANEVGTRLCQMGLAS